MEYLWKWGLKVDFTFLLSLTEGKTALSHLNQEIGSCTNKGVFFWGLFEAFYIMHLTSIKPKMKGKKLKNVHMDGPGAAEELQICVATNTKQKTHPVPKDPMVQDKWG